MNTTMIPIWAKIAYYKLHGRKPWSKGYSAFLFHYIQTQAMENQAILEKFKHAQQLPYGYGYGLDVRAVEHPWILTHLPSGQGTLLDVGASLNHKNLLESPCLKNKKITILNLNPEANCFWKEGISYIFDDARKLPFRDDCFDCLTCIATLFCIGMDNTMMYIEDARYREQNFSDFEKAVSEFKRVLKQGGKALITVCVGKYQNLGRLQQFDSQMILRIREIFQPRNCAITSYQYSKDGWNISDEASCRNIEYFDFRTTKYFDKKNTLGFDEDLAAASRSVACIEMTK